MANSVGQRVSKIYQDWSGGVNNYISKRKINDNQSPDFTNGDFYGLGGIGNRLGYTQQGTVTGSYTSSRGLCGINTSVRRLIKFVSDGSSTVLHYLSSSWTSVTTHTFDPSANLDVCQGGGYIFTGNGIDAMWQYDGTTMSATTNGATGFYPTYYDKRIWVVDPSNKDTLKFSGQYPSKLGDFVDASAGTVVIRPGSGAEIRGMIPFKNSLYVWLYPLGVYQLTPATAANTFTVTLVTNYVGCTSHRSICQVGEDVFFSSDEGIFSLGAVAFYTDPRSTNKSLPIQQLFTNMTSSAKSKLVGKYYRYKYHLFYSLYGGENDSCVCFDTRYNAWVDWRNIDANMACVFTDSTGDTQMYFATPTTGEVHKMYSGITDDGAPITSNFYSKSFDYGLSDVMKLFFDTTFVFTSITGSVSLTVIFNDNEIQVPITLSQQRPLGGFGYVKFGGSAFGKSPVHTPISNKWNIPQRMKAKGQKFAIQYRISSSGSWQLDSIAQMYSIFDHYKLPTTSKIN